jgi:hypothetical protein
MATAATFKEAWRMVDAILEVARGKDLPGLERTRAEDVV